LIEDLLDVARITAGKIRLELSDIEPSKVVAAAIDVVRPAALSKQIELVTNLDATAVAVSADPERLQQVIWNLLTNAIKFTPERGRVEIRLRYVDSNMEITVSDTGQGIREDFLPYVFDRFRQADVSETRTHGGVGLGLSIVRHLVDLHHGTVSVKSDGEGKGATFTLLLPVRHAEENRSAANHPQHEMEAQ
jgi:two-component system CheB/CheR fusion protein